MSQIFWLKRMIVSQPVLLPAVGAHEFQGHPVFGTKSLFALAHHIQYDIDGSADVPGVGGPHQLTEFRDHVPAF